MKSRIVPALRTITASVFACLLVAAVAAQDKQKKEEPKLSDGEIQAIAKINAASGLDAKLKAAAEFIKKNGKSAARPRVASAMAGEIDNVNDPAQRLALIGEYNKVFNQPAEADLVKPAMIEAISRQNKFDEVIIEGGKYLEKNPDDVAVLTLVAYAGANAVQKQPTNTALVQKTTQAAAKAVELMEADKKPEKMDATYWGNFRNSWLPRLYQAQGVVLFSSGDKTGAKDKLEKSMGLDPYDANALLMLSNVYSDEYQALAQRYQTERKTDLLNQALAKMDELVDVLARAVAVMEGDARFQPMMSQAMENLKSYYSYRHNNSTDGMKELIEKYKKK